ncbi:peptidase [Helicobacter sp. CLO-3]|uniref:L,D-transpeptidase Cds6 family protein n=1 Tax=unclassified Helicobacter TaxID=2593540 RepID=UPI000805750B|nr:MULTISPECIES: L,D-transpeptidase family protein [unclassified Helicobacter]OBV28580.1 peptidase [Helicobacter sp. CLO-3]OHU81787.1 peptidase [Helicobacter sp. CLO-3]
MKIWRLVCAMCLSYAMLFGFDKDTANIIQTYRTKDIADVEKLLESYLQKKDFWLSVLGDRQTDFGYFEGYEYLFVSDKAAPNLALYKIAPNGALTLTKQISALVAKGKGHKRTEGDLTTPIGVYDFTGRLTGLPPYYGPLAYATDYPNNYDKSLKKTGHGIWIHGLPLDGNREELNTKGCIAIDNNVLSEFGKIVDYKKALLITYEQNIHKPTKDEIATILAQLYAWRAAWVQNDLDTYLSYYSADFARPDGMKHRAFSEYKRQVFAKNEDKTIIFSDISVVPYPNEEHRQMFRISFNQDYRALKNGKPSYTSNSRKILYVEYKNASMQILSEK